MTTVPAAYGTVKVQGMPKRPRQHTLEDESKNQFRQAIPSTWVYREASSDYGIDAEIEIFDEDGESKGLIFFCQLKATDNEELGKALKFRIRKDLYDYYLSLSIPVMLVSYHSPTRKIFWHWIHEFDPYYGGKGKKTWGFSIPPRNAWGNETPKLVQEDLELQRYLQPGHLGFPLPFYLDIDEDYVPKSPWSDIQISLEKIQASLSNIVTISRKRPEKEAFKISLRGDKVIIGIRRNAGFTFHIEENYYRETEPDNIARDIIVSIAFYLGSMGYVREACELASKHFAASKVVESEFCVMMMATFFMRARKLSSSIDVAEELLKRGPQLAHLFSIPARAMSDDLSITEAVRYEKLLKNILKLAKEKMTSKAIAPCHYNLGNYYRSREKMYLKRALRHYKLAKKCDESYEKREYYWREIGGIYFELDMFTISARCYKMALDLGIEDKSKADLVKALRADALMFSGKYAKAKDLLELYLSEANEAEDEFCLKRTVMKILVDQIGIKSQKRDPETATKIAAKQELDYKSLYGAIEKDALSALAWFNIGVGAGLADEREEAFFAFLAAAIINRHDLEAWFNCVKLWLGSNYNMQLFIHIAACAYKINGVVFLEGLKSDLIEQRSEGLSQDMDSITSAMMDAVVLVAEQVDREKDSFDLRLHSGQDYKTIPIR